MNDTLGPVSAVLEGEVRGWLSRHGLVIWLDADAHYSDFVERLIDLRKSGQLKYDVFTFRGSHLELMLELEDVTGGIDTTHAVIHMPGFNKQTVRATPLFELYCAGKCYLKALDTLIRDAAAGTVRPDQIDEFLQRDNATLAAADLWLHDLLTTGSEGLASQLRNVSLRELVDDLLFKRFVAQRIEAAHDNEGADQRTLWDRIVALTGMPETSRHESLLTTAATAEGIAYTISSWALCVSYVCDLTAPPRSDLLQAIPALPAKVKEACCDLTKHLQDTHADFYRQTADETESRLAAEIEEVDARDLGRIDTFRFEEELVLKAALQALQDLDWPAAQNSAALRSDPNTFWLRNDALRRNVWHLVAGAARLGMGITAAGRSLKATDSVYAAVEEYTRLGAEVDQAHRHLEQDRQKLLRSQMPEFAAVRLCLDQMTVAWRDWANAWARGFNAVCKTHGFLPDTGHQQRTLFDESVRPLTSEKGTTAYFVIDALRYEMGRELLAAVEDAAQTNVKLDWRLCELPSVTEVGMNVLAPVAKGGRLQPELSHGKILGFSTGEFRVSDPETRRRAMHDRIGGRTCPRIELHEVLRLEAKTLKRKIAGARLVMIHSREIDSAGEEGFGPTVFETVMKDLRSAWHLLREAGVKHFVFTADHGFLLIDEESHTAQTHGRKVDPKRRHVISDRAANHTDEVRVAMQYLGYDCDNAHLMFPDSVAVFDTGTKRKGFAHGGNSFQERVIPVLTVSHRALVGGSTTAYDVTASKRDGVAGMHCIAGKVADAQRSLDFGSSYELDLALRVPDVPGIRTALCETRGGARLSSGTVIATVGEDFELFFRLSGNTGARVLVELYHPSQEAKVESCILKERFEVSWTADTTILPNDSGEVANAETWLSDLPEGPVRRVFLQLSQHGAVTETEVAEMLGSAREQRKFARNFEKYAASAPFTARIDVVSGVKRYIREGATP